MNLLKREREGRRREEKEREKKRRKEKNNTLAFVKKKSYPEDKQFSNISRNSGKEGF